MINDLIGRRFGSLTVIEHAENDKSGHPRWLCRCDCGKTKVVYESNLMHSHTRSCGCQWNTGRKPKDLVGMKFGALTVLKSLGIKSISYCDGEVVKRQMFLCQCACGKLKEYSSCDLHSGVKTCGCRNRSLYKSNKQKKENSDDSTTI